VILYRLLRTGEIRKRRSCGIAVLDAEGDRASLSRPMKITHRLTGIDRHMPLAYGPDES